MPRDTIAHEILYYIEINDEHIIMKGNWGYPKQHEGKSLQDNNQQNSICFQQKSEIIFIFSYQSQSAPSLNFPLKFLSEPLPLIFTKDEVQYVSSERRILNFNYLIECYLPQDWNLILIGNTFNVEGLIKSPLFVGTKIYVLDPSIEKIENLKTQILKINWNDLVIIW